MKSIKFILVSLFFSVAIQVSYSQDHERISELNLKVSEFERKQSNVVKRVCKRGATVRKYVVNTQIDSSRLISKHKIKYFKSGAKKEKIKYFLASKDGKILLLYLVKIDGLATYVKYCETDKNFKGDQGIVQEEVLIDHMYYQKRSFDKYGHLTGTENIYIDSRDE